MINDYMFRTILQKNKKVLRGLISSLLHMLAQNNDYVDDIMQTMYECNDDENTKRTDENARLKALLAQNNITY